jgi:hypothetical protein
MKPRLEVADWAGGVGGVVVVIVSFLSGELP